MELPNVGKQCSEQDCKQLDFLPFRCTCGKVYCSEHFYEHRNTCLHQSEGKCELKTFEGYKCAEPGCRTVSVLPIICTNCNQQFCISHRHISTCSKTFQIDVSNQMKETLRQQMCDEVKTAVDKQVDKSIANAKKKNAGLANKLHLMRLKSKAEGIKSIPVSERVYFYIQEQTTKQEHPMFVSREWSLDTTEGIKMPEPLICTVNSFGNVDYGTPIMANKITDYRTSTGTYHRLIPYISQGYDIRIKAKINKELLQRAVEVRDYTKTTTNQLNYYAKGTGHDTSMNAFRSAPASTIHYTRAVQEKMYKEKFPPLHLGISEMKDHYRKITALPLERTVFPPEPYAKCEIQGIGRDEQPPIHPESKGYWKWTDPYLTTSRAAYVPFSVDQQNGIARKDIITFYDTCYIPKCKGFGPKGGPDMHPLVSNRDTAYDKVTFDKPANDTIVHIPKDRVPHQGMMTEYRGNYKDQTYSHIFPYLFENGVEYINTSFPAASKFQTWAAPGMYTTEYSHISTRRYVNAVVATDVPIYGPPHTPCCIKYA